MIYAFFKAGCKSKEVYFIHKMFLQINPKLFCSVCITYSCITYCDWCVFINLSNFEKPNPAKYHQAISYWVWF